jgi:hypothetical protein
MKQPKLENSTKEELMSDDSGEVILLYVVDS